MREKSISKLINSKKGLFHSIIQDGSCQAFPSRGSTLTGAPRDPFHACHPSGSNETSLVQASKSTSNKRLRRKRDILLGLPHSEFLGIASTFSGLVLSLLFGLTIYNNTSASSINITLTGNPELNLVKSNTEPVFGTTASTPQTATITSDHFTGYTLTIAGLDDIGSLKGANDNTKSIPSIQAAISESTFRNDTQYNDTWGFLPNKLHVSGTTINNSNYQPAPKLAGTTIDVTTSPTSSEGNKYELALGAKITPAMSLDSYGQTFILAATGNNYNYHIGYTDTMATMPEDQYGEGVTTEKVNLSAITPTKDGYVFGGWCAEKTTNTENGTTCPSGATVYSVGQEIELNGASANNMQLYAIWNKGYDTFADAFAGFHKITYGDTGYYAMQDITPEICDSIAIGSPATNENIAKNTLIDTRDNSTYLVAKYADGHCWMRQNLGLMLDSTKDTVAYDYETGETFNYRPAHTTQMTTEDTVAWNEDGSDGARSHGIYKDKYVGGMDVLVTGTLSDSGEPYERIGVYYNWPAAVARNTGGAGLVTTSICPDGWRLPGISGEYAFATLVGAYGLPTTTQRFQAYSGQMQNPLNFNRPGYYLTGGASIIEFGVNGHFWSASGGHYFFFNNDYFVPVNSANQGAGFPVRCVAV